MTQQQFRMQCEFHAKHIGIYMTHGYKSDEQRHRNAITALHAKYPDYIVVAA